MFWKSPYFLLILATCLWGGNFVAGKWIVTELPPIILSMFRWGIALLVLIPWTGKQLWRDRHSLMTHWKIVLFLSITGIASFNTFAYVSVQYTSSINAAVMNAATPIVTVVLSWFMLRERLRLISVTGILISLAGVMWIISRGSLSALVSLSFNLGDLWMLLAVLCWALYSVGMKKAAGLFNVNSLFAATIIFALVLLIPSAIIEYSIREPEVQWSLGLVSGILYVGVLASIVAFTAWNKAIALIGPSRSSGFLNLIALFSAIFATLFAGERLHLYHVLGALLIVTGVYVTNRTLRVMNHKAALPVKLT